MTAEMILRALTSATFKAGPWGSLCHELLWTSQLHTRHLPAKVSSHWFPEQSCPQRNWWCSPAEVPLLEWLWAEVGQEALSWSTKHQTHKQTNSAKDGTRDVQKCHGTVLGGRIGHWLKFRYVYRNKNTWLSRECYLLWWLFEHQQARAPWEILRQCHSIHLNTSATRRARCLCL